MAAKTLYGAPSEYITHKDYTADQVWKKIQAAEKRGDIITTGSPGTPSGSHDE